MSTPQSPSAPALAPYLTVSNATDAIAFYKKAFGAEELSRQPTPDGKKIIHAALHINGALVMLCDDFPEMSGGKSRTPQTYGGTSVTLHLNVARVDDLWTRVTDAGATVVMPLADQFWGDRYGIIEDPFGHRWSMATIKKVATQDELDAGAKKHFT